MTVYKAFRNFYIFLLVFAIALGAGTAGLAAYELFYKEEAVYAVSKYGSSGDEVRRVQQKLSDLGYYKGRVDGIYGTNTQSAVRSFQRNVGLTADGIAGSATLLYLGLGGSGTTNNTSYSDADVQLLGKVISAEARGESYEGQVAVGAVILNRVAHSSFPDSISGVVYQNGAFSCVNDSNWYQPISETSKKAAIDALNGWDPSGGAIYYFNPAKTNDKFMHSRPVIAVIGSHKFCK
ncbi:MAG: spore cortex-lytic enzyme [Eubacterium sp.]|nr:spore cortex-lytic enzyme [Eubacterium sp.]